MNNVQLAATRRVSAAERVPLVPIRTEQELDAATVVIHSLIDLDKLSGPEQDYLAVLTDLVEAYEAEHYPSEPVSDAEMLQYLIAIKGLSQAAAAKGAGIAESTLSEVLSGKRTLNRKQIGKVAKFFGVGAGVFEFGGIGLLEPSSSGLANLSGSYQKLHCRL